MLLALINIILWSIAVVGWGYPVVRIFFPKALETRAFQDRLLLELLSGLAILGVLAQIVNFFSPINSWIVSIALAGGILLFSIDRLRHPMKIQCSRSTIIFALFWLLILTINTGLLTSAYDTGLYHLQSIKWMNATPVPFGLANLHNRFGFNSAWFSINAMLRQIPWQANGPGYFLPAQILAWLYGIAAWLGLVNMLNHKIRLPSDIFLAATSLILLSGRVRGQLNSPSPDLPIVLVIFTSVYFCLRAFDRQIDWLSAIHITTFLALFGMTIKLSAVPMFLLPVILWVIARREGQAPILKALILPIVGMFSLFVLPWLLRGTALSGCLVYPVAFTCIPTLPWSEDPSSAMKLSRIIYAWARLPHAPPEQVLANWSWLKPWLAKNMLTREMVMLAALTLAGALLLWRARIRFGNSAAYIKEIALLITGLSLGSVYWFLTAPDIRFGVGYLLSIPLVVISGWLSAMAPLESFSPNLSGAQKAVFTLIVFMAVFGLVLLARSSIEQLRHLAGTPSMLLSDLDTIPSVQVRARQTNSGDFLYVPTSGDRCWGAQLPCTPQFNENIQFVNWGSSHPWILDSTYSGVGIK